MAANAKSTSSKDSSSKGSSPKGSLSSLIARARAAQEIDEATPKAVPAPTPTLFQRCECSVCLVVAQLEQSLKVCEVAVWRESTTEDELR